MYFAYARRIHLCHRGGYMFFFYDYYMYSNKIYLFVAISILAISVFANLRIALTFSKYSKIKCNLTGIKSSEIVLKQNDVSGVEFYKAEGYLSDHFDPTSNSISLSGNVYNKNSISAVGVGAHEAGHAVQFAQNYFPMRLRHFFVPITNFSSQLATPLVFLGLILPVQYSFVIDIGIALFSISILFHMITLPVESDASNRALIALEDSGMLSQDELEGARKVLMAARFTYIAAIVISVLSLIRLILISQNRKRK